MFTNGQVVSPITHTGSRNRSHCPGDAATRTVYQQALSTWAAANPGHNDAKQTLETFERTTAHQDKLTINLCDAASLPLLPSNHDGARTLRTLELCDVNHPLDQADRQNLKMFLLEHKVAQLMLPQYVLPQDISTPEALKNHLRTLIEGTQLTRLNVSTHWRGGGERSFNIDSAEGTPCSVRIEHRNPLGMVRTAVRLHGLASRAHAATAAKSDTAPTPDTAAKSDTAPTPDTAAKSDTA